MELGLRFVRILNDKYFIDVSCRPERLQYGSLVLRRRRDKEQRVYNEIFPYSSADYEVLLRHWPTEPYLNYLAALYTPGVTTDPESSLVKTIHEWTSKLANSAGYSNRQGIEGEESILCIFSCSSVRSKGCLFNCHWRFAPASSVWRHKNYWHVSHLHHPHNMPRYSSPTISHIPSHSIIGSQVVSCYPPDSFHYCKFYSLQCLLQDMYSNVITIHPSTKEMLATLDRYY